ncbi:MAG: nuclear transport factor 2 family protein [Burkholderiales bacterium]
MTTPESERLETMLKAFGQAFNRHDADALVAMMTGDCVFRMAMGSDPNGTEVKGREAVRQAFLQTFKNFPDARWVPRAPDFVAGNRGVSEWTFQATRKSDGVRFDMAGLDVFTFRDGKIAIKDSFRKERTPES